MEDSCQHSQALLGVMQRPQTRIQQQLRTVPQELMARLLLSQRISTSSSQEA
jgi:hypothetical protein